MMFVYGILLFVIVAIIGDILIRAEYLDVTGAKRYIRANWYRLTGGIRLAIWDRKRRGGR